MKNFALIGSGGFVAPRHLKAIHDTNCRLLAAVDPNDSVGVLDQYFSECRFFTEIERFDRHLEKLRRQSEDARVHYISICSPNYLHDAHVRLALRLHAHAVCEKPLVINPWNLEALAEIAAETKSRVYTILQLRLHPSLIELKRKLESAGESRAGRRMPYVCHSTRTVVSYLLERFRGQIRRTRHEYRDSFIRSVALAVRFV